jgi:hypothetical protein
MTDKKSSESRRKLLKSIATGGGAVIAGKSLPENWTRPVVDSVMLPAHAQASGGPFAGNANLPNGALESDSVFAQFVDTLIPEAHAIEFQNPYVCVTPNATMDKANVKLYAGDTTFLFEFPDVPVNGSSCGDFVPVSQCPPGNGFDDYPICCYLDSVTGVGAGRIDLDDGVLVISFSVGPAPCNPMISCPE